MTSMGKEQQQQIAHQGEREGKISPAGSHRSTILKSNQHYTSQLNMALLLKVRNC